MICEIQLLLQLITANKMIRSWMFIISNHYGIKSFSNLLHLESSNVMFKIISDRMAHWYDLCNRIVIATSFCNAKKMICALMFIISNHDKIKCFSNLLQLQPCNVIFKVISEIMGHWKDL